MVGMVTRNEDALWFDRYRVVEPLSSGGYGKVYVAWDERVRRRVVIKHIPGGALDHGSAVHEARTAAMLSHPNIVSIFDIEIATDDAFIIMEYVEGVTLAEVDRNLSDNAVAAIFKQVASALEYAHRNGVLHLDIKPGNIMVNPEGHAKVLDFGMASLSSPAGYSAAEGGTVGYMPLEQLEGGEPGEYTDQWALAALLYQLLTDEFPYADAVNRNPSLEEMLEVQLESEPALLSTGDAELDEVFTRALSRNPDARYLSVAAFVDAVGSRLGSADLGRAELHAVVSEMLIDDEPEYWDEETPARGLLRERGEHEPIMWHRYTAQAVAGFFSWLITWRTLAAAPDSEWVLSLTIAAVVGVITAFAPRLGVIITALVAGAALGLAGQWVLAFAIILGIVPWWYFVGRNSTPVSAIATVLLAALVEFNYAGVDLWADILPQLFADNILWVNFAIVVALILVSAPTIWTVWNEREE